MLSSAADMLLTVADFRNRVNHGLDELVDDLQEVTGRYGDAESSAWRESFTALDRIFSNPKFDALHLYLSPKGHLSLEYQLPASSSWADVVLLGAHEDRAAAVILELKHWEVGGDRPGPVEGLVYHQGRQTLHPSDQVRGYTEYCRRFHSAVHARKANIHGCALFTKALSCEPYRAAPNSQLAEDYPCITMSEADVGETFPDYLAARVTVPDPAFAKAFEQGFYHQDRDFIRQIGQQIEKSDGPFELLDGQREAFARVRAVVEEVATSAEVGKKQVVIVKGPPGSGKSVVAAKTWAALAQDLSVANCYLGSDR